MAGQSPQCRGKRVPPVPPFLPLPPLNQCFIFPAQSTPGPCLLASRQATRPKHYNAGPTMPNAAALPSRLKPAPRPALADARDPCVVFSRWMAPVPGNPSLPSLPEPQHFTGSSLTDDVSTLLSTRRNGSPEPRLARPTPGMAGSSLPVGCPGAPGRPEPEPCTLPAAGLGA